jgi:transcriptional regulator
MYVPSYTAEQNNEKLISFMRKYSFAVLISPGFYPEITPLPFVISDKPDGIKLITHIAKSNPQWKNIEKKNVLVLFQGPHCYISPDYYESRINVPTWNYTVVAAYGKAKIFHDRKKHVDLVHSMFEIMEPKFRKQWEELPREYKDNLFDGITGLEVNVEKLEGKFKLSQNKSENEQKRIIEGLSRSNDSLQRGIAEMMKENLKKFHDIK